MVVVKVDFQHALAALSHLDVLHVDILNDAASAGVGLYTQHAVQLRGIHDAVVCKDILATAAYL